MALQSFLDFEIDAHHRQLEASREVAHRSAIDQARRAQRDRQRPPAGTTEVPGRDDARPSRRQLVFSWLRAWPVARLGRRVA